MEFDHLAWGSKSLSNSMSTFAELSGLEAQFGGIHAGGKTCNATVPLGAGTYLALDAPAPDLSDVLVAETKFGSMTGFSMYMLATRSDDLAKCAEVLGRYGLKATVSSGGRTTPTGVQLEWETLVVNDTGKLGSAFPQIYRWKGPAHPGQSGQDGCSVEHLSLEHPEVKLVTDLYRDLGMAIQVHQAKQDKIIVTFRGLKGAFQLPDNDLVAR